MIDSQQRNPLIESQSNLRPMNDSSTNKALLMELSCSCKYDTTDIRASYTPRLKLQVEPQGCSQ